jgi:hypothetical protein
MGWSLPTTGGNLEKGPRDRLYVPTLCGERGLGAHPEGMPRVGEPQEKELCADPPAAFGHDNEPGGSGAVFSGGLRLGFPATYTALTTTTTTTMMTMTTTTTMTMTTTRSGSGLAVPSGANDLLQVRELASSIPA